MLQRATAAFAEMAAHGLGAVRSGNEDTVVAHAVDRRRARHMAAVACHAVATRGDALDPRSFAHVSHLSARRLQGRGLYEPAARYASLPHRQPRRRTHRKGTRLNTSN